MRLASTAGFELRRRPRHYATNADSFLKSVIQDSNPMIIDAGANEGQSVSRFHRIWPNATIHCFEPAPEAFLRLKETHENHSRVYLNELGLSSQPGEGELSVLPNRTDLSSLEGFNQDAAWFAQRAAGNAVTQSAIRLESLDGYWGNYGEKISFLKIDTQGHELEVLRGADAVLADPELRPTAIEVEINIGHAYSKTTHLWEIDQPLASNGYFAAYLKRPFNLLADPHQQIDLIYVHRETVQR